MGRRANKTRKGSQSSSSEETSSSSCNASQRLSMSMFSSGMSYECVGNVYVERSIKRGWNNWWQQHICCIISRCFNLRRHICPLLIPLTWRRLKIYFSLSAKKLKVLLISDLSCASSSTLRSSLWTMSIHCLFTCVGIVGCDVSLVLVVSRHLQTLDATSHTSLNIKGGPPISWL